MPRSPIDDGLNGMGETGIGLGSGRFDGDSMPSLGHVEDLAPDGRGLSGVAFGVSSGSIFSWLPSLSDSLNVGIRWTIIHGSCPTDSDFGRRGLRGTPDRLFGLSATPHPSSSAGLTSLPNTVLLSSSARGGICGEPISTPERLAWSLRLPFSLSLSSFFSRKIHPTTDAETPVNFPALCRRMVMRLSTPSMIPTSTATMTATKAAMLCFPGP